MSEPKCYIGSHGPMSVEELVENAPTISPLSRTDPVSLYELLTLFTPIEREALYHSMANLEITPYDAPFIRAVESRKRTLFAKHSNN